MIGAGITARGGFSVRDAEVQALRLLQEWGLGVIVAVSCGLIGKGPKARPRSTWLGFVVEACLNAPGPAFAQLRWRCCPHGWVDPDSGTRGGEPAALRHERLLPDPSSNLDGDRREGTVDRRFPRP
jgi:hypothetical protein